MKQRSWLKDLPAVLGLLLVALPVGARAQSPAEEMTTPVELDALVAEALEQNPGVQAMARRVGALRYRVSQAQSLPDPTISVGWMGNIKPFGVMRDDPSSYRGITAMQEIPYPGKLKLRGQLADREADAAWWDYEAARRQVVAEVKTAYYEYAFARTALDITRSNQDLLERLARIAETRYRVGKGLQQDVLKSHVELSRLRQRLTLYEQQARTAQARLNTLRARDPEALLGPPAALAPVELSYQFETLYQLARENDTGLRREEKLIARQQVAVNLARKEYYPDFGIGYNYWNRPLMPEMHGFTFSLNIPVFYKSKQRAAVAEGVEELRAAERMREDRETTVAFRVKEHFLTARASQELYRLYSQAIVPQSSLALESALSAYEVGTVDFLTVMESYSTVLDFEVDYYRELANYLTALARLEPLVGVELTK